MTLETIYPPEVKALQDAIRGVVRDTIENYFRSDEGENRIRKILENMVERDGIEVVACHHCQEDDKEHGEES